MLFLVTPLNHWQAISVRFTFFEHKSLQSLIKPSGSGKSRKGLVDSSLKPSSKTLGILLQARRRWFVVRDDLGMERTLHIVN